MVRTAVNVTGDATVSTVVAYHEGQLDEVIFNDPDADLDETETGESSETAS
jgi:Na+/H+-dicarboxylate symporter